MYMQSRLIQKIQNHLSVEKSLIEAVAIVLDISYDAAFRRVHNKCRISIDEAFKLAFYFGISMDELFNGNDGKHLLVEKSLTIDSEEKMAAYFEQSYTNLNKILKQRDTHMYYSAKDLPIFYTLGNNILSRFKYFVWLKILHPTFKSSSFETFAPRTETLSAAIKLGSLYKNINKTEIWDLTTVNSTLKQVQYYFSLDQLSQKSALQITYGLSALLKELEINLLQGKDNTTLFYSELVLLNNNVLVITPEQYSLYVPHNILSYFQTHQIEICRKTEQFLKHQLKSCKGLNSSGEKDIKLFFGKLYKKTDALADWIKSSTVLDFD